MKHPAKKVLVTGGAGFIGSSVCDEFGRYGYDVYVADNLSFGNRNTLKVHPDHFFEIDILNREALGNCFKQVSPEIVIHLAAIHFIPYCNAHPFISSNINIQGTINVLKAAEDSGVKQFLFASTAAVYPIASGPLNEEMETGATDIYGLTKVAGEQFCADFAMRSKIPTLSCRFFNAFGENETNPHLVPEIQRQLLNGERRIQLGNLEPKRDYIHTLDLARAIRMLLEKFSNGYEVFNIGSGREYSVKEIVEAFEESIGEKLVIEQDVSRIRKIDRPHLLADIAKLQRFIPWEPSIDIVQGIGMLMRNKQTV